MTMTEEVEVPVKHKQYILIVDDTLIPVIGALFPSLRFVEVEGMTLEQNPAYNLLVNPKEVKKEENAPGA